MDYKNACKIFGVNETDSLESILEKYNALVKICEEDIQKYSDYISKKILEELKEAFKIICKHYKIGKKDNTTSPSTNTSKKEINKKDNDASPSTNINKKEIEINRTTLPNTGISKKINKVKEDSLSVDDIISEHIKDAKRKGKKEYQELLDGEEYDSFVDKFCDACEKDENISFYLKRTHIDYSVCFYLNYYEKYYKLCLKHNIIPETVMSWLIGYSKIDDYYRCGFGHIIGTTDENCCAIDAYVKTYNEDIIRTGKTFFDFSMETFLQRVNDAQVTLKKKRYCIQRYILDDVKLFQKYADEYVSTKPKIEFTKFLDGKMFNYSPLNVKRNIEKILEDRGFDNVTDEEIIEILRAVKGDNGINEKTYSRDNLRTKNTFITILVAYADRYECGQWDYLTSDTRKLVELYYESNYFFRNMSFEHFCKLIEDIKLHYESPKAFERPKEEDIEKAKPIMRELKIK